MVTITDWRCSVPSCGQKLAARVVVTSGWIERKCYRCKAVSHLGDRRNGEPSRRIPCPTPLCEHTIAEASSSWKGDLTCKCRNCRKEVDAAA